jgi:hypothetical protein
MGQPAASPTLASTVWVKEGNKWLAAFHQETPVMAPPQKAMD